MNRLGKGKQRDKRTDLQLVLQDADGACVAAILDVAVDEGRVLALDVGVVWVRRMYGTLGAPSAFLATGLTSRSCGWPGWWPRWWPAAPSMTMSALWRWGWDLVGGVREGNG